MRFGALRKPSFRVSNVGGSVYRLVISAAPFLLPLMFQVGFGWSPVLAGSLVLMLFLGNVGIKPATSPLIRRFGFRVVLIASIAGGAIVFGLIATLSASSPLPLVGALLLLSGVFRSVGFSAYNSLQFADIDPRRCPMPARCPPPCNRSPPRWGSPSAPLSYAVADRVLGPSALPAWPYVVAFLVLALLLVWPLVEAIRLHRTAGDEVAAR